MGLHVIKFPSDLHILPGFVVVIFSYTMVTYTSDGKQHNVIMTLNRDDFIQSDI